MRPVRRKDWAIDLKMLEKKDCILIPEYCNAEFWCSKLSGYIKAQTFSIYDGFVQDEAQDST